MKRHRGPEIQDRGIIVKDEDYNGRYAIRVLTEHGEEFEFVVEEEDLDRLNRLTSPPYGQDESEDGFIARLKSLICRGQ